jgi:hypothetical protein
MSLQYFIKNWSEAMEELSRESFLKSIASRIDGNEEEDYEDE